MLRRFEPLEPQRTPCAAALAKELGRWIVSPRGVLLAAALETATTSPAQIATGECSLPTWAGIIENPLDNVIASSTGASATIRDILANRLAPILPEPEPTETEVVIRSAR